MAEFQGYLLKIKGRELPNKYLQTYKVTPDQQQDKDSYQDVTGELHREILPHTRSKIDFTTPYLWMADKTALQSYFPDRKAEPKVSVEYWNDERNEYVTGVFYVPDVEFQVYRIVEKDMEYFPIRIALIEY